MLSPWWWWLDSFYNVRIEWQICAGYRFPYKVVMLFIGLRVWEVVKHYAATFSAAVLCYGNFFAVCLRVLP